MNRYDVLHGSVPCGEVTEFNLTLSQLVTPNIVDPLCVDKHLDSEGKVRSISFTSDVSLLFNQQRLESSLGADGVKKFFDSLSSRSPALSALRSKCSDKDLLAMCKSRYLQAPCEVLAWSEYLNANYESLLHDIRSRSVKTESAPTDSAPSDSAPSESAPTDSAPASN